MGKILPRIFFLKDGGFQNVGSNFEAKNFFASRRKKKKPKMTKTPKLTLRTSGHIVLLYHHAWEVEVVSYVEAALPVCPPASRIVQRQRPCRAKRTGFPKSRSSSAAIEPSRDPPAPDGVPPLCPATCATTPLQDWSRAPPCPKRKQRFVQLTV